MSGGSMACKLKQRTLKTLKPAATTDPYRYSHPFSTILVTADR